MNQKLFFGSCVAMKSIGAETNIQVLSFLAVAISLDESMGMLLSKAQEIYPVGDKWSHHGLQMHELNDERALKVASQNYVDLLTNKVGTPK